MYTYIYICVFHSIYIYTYCMCIYIYIWFPEIWEYGVYKYTEDNRWVVSITVDTPIIIGIYLELDGGFPSIRAPPWLDGL